MLSQRKCWWVIAAVLLLLIGGLVSWRVFAFLEREGYVHPIHYVKYNRDGTIDREGFRMRERYLLPSKNDDWYEQGKMTGYHPNGKKSVEGSYERGREVGVWKMWEADGTLCDVTEHVEYSPHGICTRYTKYEHGVAKVVSETWWDDRARQTWLNPDGTPSKVEVYDYTRHIWRAIEPEKGDTNGGKKGKR